MRVPPESSPDLAATLQAWHSTVPFAPVEVITKGYGAMPDHAAQIPPTDRWRIVAYVRALQASRVPETGDKTGGARGER